MQNNKGSTTPITVTYDSFSITGGGVAVTGHPSVTQVRPRDGSIAVSRDTFIAADVNLPNSGIDPATLNGNVLLFRSSDHKAIPGVINTSGGGDAIVFTPSNLLDANTNYMFQITAGVKDTSGATFHAVHIKLHHRHRGRKRRHDGLRQASAIGQPGEHLHLRHRRPGSQALCDDHRRPDRALHHQRRWLAGQLADDHHDRTTTTAAPRRSPSIVFDPSSTASNLIAYVSHSAPSLTNAPDWSGKISKLTGPNLGTYQNLVYGLPRSIRDHMNNQLVFGPDGKLYFGQAANNAMGAPDKAWGNRPDHLLNDAVLQLDLSKLTARHAFERADRQHRQSV